MVTVRLVNVTKIFGRRVIGVKDINLTVNHGEFMALLDPGGSGEFATLYLIAGIYKLVSCRIYFDA